MDELGNEYIARGMFASRIIKLTPLAPWRVICVPELWADEEAVLALKHNKFAEKESADSGGCLLWKPSGQYDTQAESVYRGHSSYGSSPRICAWELGIVAWAVWGKPLIVKGLWTWNIVEPVASRGEIACDEGVRFEAEEA